MVNFKRSRMPGADQKAVIVYTTPEIMRLRNKAFALGRIRHRRKVAKAEASALNMAQDVVTDAAPMAPNLGIMMRWPIMARGTRGLTRAKAQTGFPPAVRMFEETEMKAMARAPKTKMARTGAAEE
jgi:hypothetical protein